MAYVKVTRQRITPLIEAVQKQDVNGVRSRIEAGDDIEATDSYGQTALHWATKYESVEIVRLLVDAGARVKARDEDGDTPLGNAKKNSNPAIAEALAKGMKTRTQSASSRTKRSSSDKKWWQFWK